MDLRFFNQSRACNVNVATVGVCFAQFYASFNSNLERRMLKGTRVLLHSVQLHEDNEQAAKGDTVHILQHLLICVHVHKPNAS